MRDDKLRKKQLITYAYGSFLVSAAVLTFFVLSNAIFGLLVYLKYFSPSDGSSFGMIMGVAILIPVLIAHIIAMLIGIALSSILHRKILVLISLIGIAIMSAIYSIWHASSSAQPLFQIGSIDILQIIIGLETFYVVLIAIFGGKWFWSDRFQ